MVEKIRDSFYAGIEKIKWFSSLMSERLKVEISVIRLINKSDKLQKERGESAMAVGQRVFELKAQEGANLLQDKKIKEALKEMERLDGETEAIKGQMAEISRAGTEE
ncbi:MAG: hypothetical protein Q8J64_01255 [Thermodesulfovibrionales bacterium]|nr:hypothetical protein [Thermodesulfovibrionales bacterium]